MIRVRSLILRDHEVRAVLAGTKTQHRLPIRFPPGVAYDGHRPDGSEAFGSTPHTSTGSHRVLAPYRIGDTVRVREAFRRHGDGSMAEATGPADFEYRASADEASFAIFTWRSASTMPLFASRISLRITDVRVQRVQDISEKDAIAEGSRMPMSDLPKPCRQAAFSEREVFARLWDYRRGTGAWDRNDYVWALTFERAETP